MNRLSMNSRKRSLRGGVMKSESYTEQEEKDVEADLELIGKIQRYPLPSQSFLAERLRLVLLGFSGGKGLYVFIDEKVAMT